MLPCHMTQGLVTYPRSTARAADSEWRHLIFTTEYTRCIQNNKWPTELCKSSFLQLQCNEYLIK